MKIHKSIYRKGFTGSKFGRLGKLPQKFDHRTLLFGRYLPKLPTPPPAIDHASDLPNDIGMMGNDSYGDCTVAAAGHMIQSWTLYAQRGMLTIPDSDILSAYFKVSPYDNGAYMLDVLNLWRKTGIGGEKVEAYVGLEPSNVDQMKLAIQYFGSAYIGLSLPDVNTFGPWTEANPTWKPNPYNGHAVNICAYDDERQMFRVCTWGEVWDMSYGWLRRYCDEGYAVLDDISLIISSGKSPEGFDFQTLQYDLLHISDPITPPEPVPTPEPIPEPTPEPPPSPVPGPETITIEITGPIEVRVVK